MAESCGVRGKQVSCDVCGVTLPSASLLLTHNNGKKHQRMLKLKEEREHSCRKSIYVRGFQNSGAIEEDLANYFSVYGKVSNIFLDKDKRSLLIVKLSCTMQKFEMRCKKLKFNWQKGEIEWIDRNVVKLLGVFAIVEFVSEESVTKVLSQLESLPCLHNKHLKVKERTLTRTGFQFRMQKSTKRGYDDSEKHHCDHLGSKEMAKFLAKDLIVKLNPLMKVDEQVNILMQQLCLTDEDIKLRRLVCQLLQEVLSEVYPGASVLPFGSTVSGVGWKGSDLDLCLLTSKIYDTIVDYSLVVDALRSFAPGCTNIIPVLTAKCPLIKFTHLPSGLSCDLSVNNRLGIRNSELLHCYMSLDPRITQLVFIVRAWAKAKAIAASRQLSNYALTLMVLHFLQMQHPPVIPSLQCRLDTWIREGPHSCDVKEPNSEVIDNWNCSFFTDITKLSPSQNTKSLIQLLEEFFYFFSTEFDFANCVVSIRTGQRTTIVSALEELKVSQCTITNENVSMITSDSDQECHRQLTKIEDSKDASKITEETTMHQNAISNSVLGCSHSSPGTGKQLEFKISPLCVQDPFELVHNLTQNITMATLRNIIELMKIAHKICQDLNSSVDDSNPIGNNLLDLFTVCTSSKKRKHPQHHDFFVKYQNKSSQALDTGCVNNLSTPHAVFVFVLETLEREYGFQCKVKSSAKMPCSIVEESGLSGKTQGDKMSLVSQLSGHISAAGCSNTRCEARISEKVKKCKSEFSAICKAFENTWTHCRRERRRSLQPQKQDNGNNSSLCKDNLTDTQSDQLLEGFKKSTSNQVEEFANAPATAQPILGFELNVSSFTQKEEIDLPSSEFKNLPDVNKKHPEVLFYKMPRSERAPEFFLKSYLKDKPRVLEFDENGQPELHVQERTDFYFRLTEPLEAAAKK